MNLRAYTLLLCSTLALSACGSTFEGIQKDFGKLSTVTGETIDNFRQSRAKNAATQDNQALADGTCPTIIIDPQLDSMSEFEDMQSAKADSLISKAYITSIKSFCKPADNMLDIRLDLQFASELGPKAKRTSNDRPFFAYPYFISVTDSKGQELAKEIFAASITYEKSQDKVELIETINQQIPLNDDGSLPAYQIHIGFQLTDEQLFYNASQNQ